MLGKYIILAAVMAFFGGCATYRDIYQEQLDNLPQHYSQFDLVLAWKIVAAGSETDIEGVVKNVRYAHIDNIEIWVSVLSPAGKPEARSVSFVIPRMLELDEIAPFSLKLPAQTTPGAKLLFTYMYKAYEGGDKRGLRWMQSFEAEVPAR